MMRRKPIACLALAAAISLALSGCAGSMPSSNVPGAYTVLPESVTSGEERTADSAVLVIAGSQGQAFKLPDGALAYAKAAIEAEGFAGYLVADGSEMHGKRYILSKSSDAGRQKELESLELDYFAAACSARSSSGDIDLLKALDDAADQLRAQGSGEERVICMVSSGLASSGLLEASEELFGADASEVASQLAEMGAISDLSNVTVRLFGLGQSTGEQQISPLAKSSIQSLWEAVVRAGGGTPVVESDVLAPLGCDEELPHVESVDLGKCSLTLPDLPKGGSAEVVLDSAMLGFRGDTAEFSDPAAATELLRGVADAASAGGYSLHIDGYTAASPARDAGFLRELSMSRARAVKSALVGLGVSASSIEVFGHGDEGSTSMASGTFDESQAERDRRVVISATKS